MVKDKSTSNKTTLIPLIVPSITVFISSFCIMVLELVAARIIAKHLGSSLYTWTAVIGVVLAGISCGNYIGGRIADRFQPRKTLAILFAVSSGTCVLITVLNNLIGEWTLLWELSWPIRVFVHVFSVFMLPSTMLGTISPVVAKMALDRGLPTGRTVGDIYAWGAAGSILGTFAAGYLLIPMIGTIAIVWAVGSILLLMAILYCIRHLPFLIWSMVFLCVMTIGTARMRLCQNVGEALALREQPDPRVIYHDETPYCYITVKRLSEEPDTRVFVQDKLVHSKIKMNNITNLQYFYTKIYAAVTQGLSIGKEKLSVMVVGGGGYVYPRYVEKMWPGSIVDVVEIDPGVTKAAIEAFGLERNTTIKTLTMDGRNHIDKLLQRQQRLGQKTLYDFVYEDAINDYSVPFQLVTKEFNDKIFSVLTQDGVYMVTLIDIYNYGRFLGAVLNTLRQTFPYTDVLTEGRMPKWARNTFVVIASKKELNLQNIISQYQPTLDLWCLSSSEMDNLKQKAQGLILTDDYAPVENLLAPVVCQSGKERLASEYIDRARKYAMLGKLGESLASYKKAAQAKPQLTTEVYNQIGLLYIRQEDFSSATDAFKKAIEHNEQTKAGHNIANIQFNLGLSLQKSGREKEARDYLLKATNSFRRDIQEDPNSAIHYEWLGNTLMLLGNCKAATEAFERAATLNPDNIHNCVNLVKALEFQQRYEEAIAVLRKEISYLTNKQLSKQTSELREYLDILELKRQTSPIRDR